MWYNGLFISGIAVDDSTGDVFFSDAAGIRVIRQSSNGTTPAIYRYGFYSPKQLAYHNQTLYVADSANNRVVWINVTSGAMTQSSKPDKLSSCSALAFHWPTSTLFVVDGWGLALQHLSLQPSVQWVEAVLLSNLQRDPPRYISSASIIPRVDWSDTLLADALTDGT